MDNIEKEAGDLVLAKSISTGSIPEEVWLVIDRIRGWLSREEASALYNLAKGTKSGVIVEIGSCQGRSTVALSAGADSGSSAPIYAIEPHEEFVGPLGGRFGPQDRRAFYSNMVQSGAYANVRLINLSSEVVTPGWNLEVELLWIDGDHRYNSVHRDLYCWKKHLARNAIIVFDDAKDKNLGPASLIREEIERGSLGLVCYVGKIAITRVRNNNQVNCYGSQ